MLHRNSNFDPFREKSSVAWFSTQQLELDSLCGLKNSFVRARESLPHQEAHM